MPYLVLLFFLVFFSPFGIAITSLGEERANLIAFRTFVRFVLVWFCRFPLPLGVWEGLRFVIVALPGLFSYLFFLLIQYYISITATLEMKQYRLLHRDGCYKGQIQSTLVISNSKGLSEILRDIRTSTYQICRIEKKLIRLTTFNKYMCNWTLEVRDILKILWKRREIAP